MCEVRLRGRHIPAESGSLHGQQKYIAKKKKEKSTGMEGTYRITKFVSIGSGWVWLVPENEENFRRVKLQFSKWPWKNVHQETQHQDVIKGNERPAKIYLDKTRSG